MEPNPRRKKSVENTIWPTAEVKPVVWPFVLVLLALLTFFALVLIKKDTDKITWWPFVVLGSLALIPLLVKKNAGLVLTHEGIRRNVIGGRQIELKWDNVTTASMNWHAHMHGANLYLELGASGVPAMLIPLSLYRRRDIVTLARYIHGLATKAECSRRIGEFAGGDLPWYLF